MSHRNRDNSLPKQIEISFNIENVSSILSKFYPSKKHYLDVGKLTGQSRAEIEDMYRALEDTTEYHIPEHQRFYVWTKKQQNDFIDTIIKNFPIPDIIVSFTGRRGDAKQIEDGQQRLTTLWRYFHNLFAFEPPDSPTSIKIYYDTLPPNSDDQCVLLGDVCPDAKRRLDDYRIQIKLITNYGDPATFTDKVSEIFERLQAGKPLADGDKIWNRRSKRVPVIAIRLGMDDEVLPHLKKCFKIDLTKIMNGEGKAVSKKPLCTLVGMVLGMSIPQNYVMHSSELWPGVMTTSYPKVCKYINLDITDSYYEVIKLGIKAICEILEDAPVGESEGGRSNRISTNHNSSFNRHLGIMIYDWRLRIGNMQTVEEIEETVLDDYIDFWSDVIGSIQITEPDLDRNMDFASIYQHGDRPNKNADIGKNIIQRHSRLIEFCENW